MLEDILAVENTFRFGTSGNIVGQEGELWAGMAALKCKLLQHLRNLVYGSRGVLPHLQAIRIYDSPRL